MILENEQTNNIDVILKLTREFRSCPTQWQNFVKSVKEEHLDWEDRADTYEILQQELIKFNASFDDVSTQALHIKFNSPEHKTWFLLKWSIQ